MKRYAAMLRGVSPMNAKMPELKRAFEAAGFTNVKTVLASGNVVFDAPTTKTATLERKAETAMRENLDRTFMTIIRPIDMLRELIDSDPWRAFRLRTEQKRVVTFLRTPPTAQLDLPITVHDARILSVADREVFTVYVPGPKAATFMTLLEKTFGKDITTRTWDSVKKLVAA